MNKLTESEIIRFMREEWTQRVNRLNEKIDTSLKTKGDKGEKIVISPDLKVKKDGVEYTVVSASLLNCVLRTPEGKKISVNTKDLEKDYELA
jgi:hypothetical protein